MDPEAATTTHIALVSIPAFSHQVSILEFAKRLIHHDNTFHVTCIIPSLGSPTTASKPFFDALPPNINCIFLPPINIEDVHNNGGSIELQIQLSLSLSMPLVHEALTSLINTIGSNNKKVAALVVDSMATEALKFGKEFNVLSYIYFPCSIMTLSLCLHSSKLDEMVSCEYRDHPQLIEIPGCVPVCGIDLPNSLQDRSSLAYKLFLQRCQQYLCVDGILVNSFMELESEATKAISLQGIGNTKNDNKPPLYPIGPIIQSGPSGPKNGWDCLLWLDNQPPNSVIYVSFGSGGTLSQEQIQELALGLELSRHKFLWVNVRAPNDRASATYFGDDRVDDPLHFLPLGFLERTKGQGLVMSGWAPQIEVLGHMSVGAFLTHCGWNSILESVVQGVPMIAWPLFAEQRTNAVLVTEGLKVALRPKIGARGVLGKEEIAGVIKSLMEGLESEGIRWRMKELQKVSACALMEDGSSTRTMSKLVFNWKSL